MRSMKRSVLMWVAIGIVGLAFAVGVGMLGTAISSERIGLSSEPLSAGGELAPAPPANPRESRPPRPDDTRTAPQQQPSAAPPPQTGSDDEAEGYERESEPDEDD